MTRNEADGVDKVDEEVDEEDVVVDDNEDEVD